MNHNFLCTENLFSKKLVYIFVLSNFLKTFHSRIFVKLIFIFVSLVCNCFLQLGKKEKKEKKKTLSRNLKSDFYHQVEMKQFTSLTAERIEYVSMVQN